MPEPMGAMIQTADAVASWQEDALDSLYKSYLDA
jgi:hypothetical protein